MYWFILLSDHQIVLPCSCLPLACRIEFWAPLFACTHTSQGVHPFSCSSGACHIRIREWISQVSVQWFYEFYYLLTHTIRDSLYSYQATSVYKLQSEALNTFHRFLQSCVSHHPNTGLCPIRHWSILILETPCLVYAQPNRDVHRNAKRCIVILSLVQNQ